MGIEPMSLITRDWMAEDNSVHWEVSNTRRALNRAMDHCLTLAGPWFANRECKTVGWAFERAKKRMNDKERAVLKTLNSEYLCSFYA